MKLNQICKISLTRLELTMLIDSVDRAGNDISWHTKLPAAVRQGWIDGLLALRKRLSQADHDAALREASDGLQATHTHSGKPSAPPPIFVAGRN